MSIFVVKEDGPLVYRSELDDALERNAKLVAALKAAKYVLEDQEGWAESDLKIRINEALSHQ